MKALSIKRKIIAPVIIIGLVLGALLAFYSPRQARSTANVILENDARFISNLLAENLALGLQTVIFDDGAALDATLDVFRREGSSHSTIDDIWVYNVRHELVRALNAGGKNSGVNIVTDTLTLFQSDQSIKIVSPMRDLDNEIIGYVEIDFSKDFLISNTSRTSFISILIAVVAVGLTIGIGIVVASRIAKPISTISSVAESISVGDIQHEIKIESGDEVGRLADSFRKLIEYMKSLADAAERISSSDLTTTFEPKSDRDVLGMAFKTMAENFSAMVRQISDNSTRLVSSASEINTSSEAMSNGAKNQADQVVQVSGAVDEIAASITEAASTAEAAADASKRASDEAEKGGEVVRATIDGMQRIYEVVGKSSESISKLASSADAIEQILSVINEISDQTNLLALNAAIEAARAGEQGRGFAVVADEVRKLAERTGAATNEITEMITEIKCGTSDAVRSMENGIEEIVKGRDLADQAGSTLAGIVQMSQNVMNMIHEIASASEHQSSAAEEISRTVGQIASVTTETASGAKQFASAAEALNSQAENLQLMVKKFKTA